MDVSDYAGLIMGYFAEEQARGFPLASSESVKTGNGEPFGLAAFYLNKAEVPADMRAEVAAEVIRRLREQGSNF